MGDYKLITTSSFEGISLYDLKNDLGEIHNIAGENPELVQELVQLLREWHRDVHKGVKKRT